MKRTTICPHCGETIPAKAISCRHCGSDRETGWATEEEISYRSVELPEPRSSEPARQRGRPLVNRVIVILLILSLALWILSRVF